MAIDAEAGVGGHEETDSRSYIGELPSIFPSSCHTARVHTEEEASVTNEYDAIVIGARCAGSPTAMLLARLGYKILPSRSRPRSRATRCRPTSSTRREWQRCSVGDCWDAWWRRDVRRLTPTRLIFVLFTLVGAPGTDEAPVGYCPRRTVLDKLLVDAASEAGADAP